MAQIFLNNCYATLAQAITATDTQITLSNMTGFPASLGVGDYFLITLYADSTRYGESVEVIKVTGLSGTTLTVERGVEGSAVAHGINERAEARLTAGTLDRIDQPNDWPSITNKPTEFLPVAHGHTWTEVSGKPTEATRWPETNEVTGLSSALAAKLAIADVVDQLTSTLTDKPLSANQGRVLKGLIDSINTLLTSNDTTLDELQEIVNYIKLNRADLDALSINSIAGLQAALNGKAAASHTHLWSEVTDKPLTYPPDTHNHDGQYYTESEIDSMLAGLDAMPDRTGNEGKVLSTDGLQDLWKDLKTINGQNLLGTGDVVIDPYVNIDGGHSASVFSSSEYSFDGGASA